MGNGVVGINFGAWGFQGLQGTYTASQFGGPTVTGTNIDTILTGPVISGNAIHNHGGFTVSASPPTDVQSNMPPYVGVIFCKKQ